VKNNPRQHDVVIKERWTSVSWSPKRVEYISN